MKGATRVLTVAVLLFIVLVSAAVYFTYYPKPTKPVTMMVGDCEVLKLEDEPGWDTFFDTAEISGDSFIVKFYHNSPEPQPVWVEGEVNYTLSADLAYADQKVTLNVQLADGQVPNFKLHVGRDSEVFEFGAPSAAEEPFEPGAPGAAARTGAEAYTYVYNFSGITSSTSTRNATYTNGTATDYEFNTNEYGNISQIDGQYVDTHNGPIGDSGVYPNHVYTFVLNDSEKIRFINVSGTIGGTASFSPYTIEFYYWNGSFWLPGTYILDSSGLSNESFNITESAFSGFINETNNELKIRISPLTLYSVGWEHIYTDYIQVEAEINQPPNQTAPIVNATSANNYTTDNVTCWNQSTLDWNNDSVKNIYTWQRSGEPLMHLNMPFEASDIYAKDYSGNENHGSGGAIVFNTFEVDAETWANGTRWVVFQDCTESKFGDCSIHLNDSSTGQAYNTVTTVENYSSSDAYFDLWYKCESGSNWGITVFNGTDWSCIQGTQANCGYISINSIGSLSPAITCDNTWRHAEYDMGANYPGYYINVTRIEDGGFAVGPLNKQIYFDHFQIYDSTRKPTYQQTGGFDGFGAYHFETDSAEMVRVPEITFGPDISIEAWIQPYAANRYIFGTCPDPNSACNGDDSPEFFLAIGGNNEIQVRYSPTNRTDRQISAATYNNAVSFGNWYHIVAAIGSENNSVRIYVNGTDATLYYGSDGTGLQSFTNKSAIGALLIPPNITINHFNGTIDDLRIYNSTLSAEQALLLYQNQTNILTFDQTAKDEVWTCNITPNDGYDDGITVVSSGLSILNTPPAHSQDPVLNSTTANNYSAENLTCHTYTTDVDEDSLKDIISWEKNGTGFMLLNMPFEGGSGNQSGTTRDYSGYGNNGTVSGAEWGDATGYDGLGAYIFSSNDTYINISDSPELNFTNNFTVSAWIKLAGASSDWNSIVGKLFYNSGSGWLLYHKDTEGVVLMSVYNTSVTEYTRTLYPFQVGDWHHVAVTVNESNGTSIYIDGELNVTGVNRISAADKSVLIGARYNNDGVGTKSNDYFRGVIDDVRIYNASLSAEQIQALYQNMTDLIVSQETEAGDNWTCSVTPNDGSPNTDGPTATSNWVYVAQNPTPPYHNTNPVLNTTTNQNLTTDDLYCWADVTDDDGDNITNYYKWYVDGSEYTGELGADAYDKVLFHFNNDSSVGEDDTTAFDYSGNSNNATLAGSYFNCSDAKLGNCALDIGGGNYAYVPNDDSLNHSNEYTIVAWLYADNLSSWDSVIAKYPVGGGNTQYHILVYNGWGQSNALLSCSNTGCPESYYILSLSNFFETGRWMHMAFVQGPGGANDIAIYKDGIAFSRLLSKGNIQNYTNNDGILQIGSSGGASFQGRIDELAIYGRALNSTEIYEIYHQNHYAKNETMPSNYTSVGENWTCEVTPYDGTYFGSAELSNNLTILSGSNPPYHIQPPILNTSTNMNYTNESLDCWAFTNDTEGDPLTNYYTWYRNGNIFTQGLTVVGGTGEFDPDASTVALFHLNNDSTLGETNSLAVDSSGIRNGTIVNAVWNCTDSAKGACSAHFDGSSAYIEIPDGNEYDFGSGNFSISLWMKLTDPDTSSTQAIVYKNPSATSNGVQWGLAYDVFNDPNNLIGIIYYLDSTNFAFLQSTANPITDTEWHYIVAQRVGNSFEIYIDGQLNASGTSLGSHGTMKSIDSTVTIGASNNSGSTGAYFDGQIDEVIVLNRSMNSSEILAHYQDTGGNYTLNSSIPSSSTNIGENWTCEVTPYDGTEYGPANVSNNLTILQFPSYAPYHIQPPILNSTSGNNYTADNITCWAFTNDTNYEPVINIVTWQRDGSNFDIINMPFEGGSNSTWTRDYAGLATNLQFHGSPTWNGTGGIPDLTVPLTATGAYNFTNSDWISFDTGGAANYLGKTYHIIVKFDALSSDTSEIFFQVESKLIFVYAGSDVGRSGQLCAVVEGSNFTCDSAPIGPGYWYQMIYVTYPNGTGILYLNGNPASDPYHTHLTDYYPDNYTMGASIDGTYQFDGIIDSLIIYNESLTPEQILVLTGTARHDTIISQETTQKETWTCSVTPNDGSPNTDGPTNTSNSLQINNNIPYHIQPPILNSSWGANTSRENLICNPFTNDTDGDPLMNFYLWQRNGTSFTGESLPDASTVALFHLNNDSTLGETNSLAVDSSGIRNGTMNAVWNCTDSAKGACSAHFDGSSAYIDIPDGDEYDFGSGNFSISAWIKLRDTEPSDDYYIVSKTYNSTEVQFGLCYNCLLAGNNELGIFYYHSSGGMGLAYLNTTANPITDNEWHHVVAQRTGDSLEIYLDGQLNASGIAMGEPGPMKSTIANISIGRSFDYPNGYNFFDGLIDEVAIYNRSLNSSEVLAQYQSQLGVRASVLPSSVTSMGDNWTCSVYPYDGFDYGPINNSNWLYVENSPPIVTQISINSTSGNNVTTDDLNCYGKVEDPEHTDFIVKVRFYKNDVLSLDYNVFKSGINGTLVLMGPLPSDQTSKGENWTCSLQASDAIDSGNETNRSIAPGNITILDSVPTQTAPYLNATSPGNYTIDNLTCWNQSTSDPDNDSVKNIYVWVANLEAIGTTLFPFEGGSNSNWTKNYYSPFGAEDGAVNGSTWLPSGGYDGWGAYSFDGQNDYINMSESGIDSTADFTISAWVKPEIGGDSYRLIYGQSDISDDYPIIWLYINGTSNNLTFDIRGTAGTRQSIESTDPIADGQWHHVAVSWDYSTNNMAMYIDGSLNSTGTASLSGTTSNTDWFGIGAVFDTDGMGTTVQHWFNGTIDEFAIYKRLLTPEQISALYSNQTNVIVSQETQIGDDWYCALMPNDGEADGAGNYSNTVTIRGVQCGPIGEDTTMIGNLTTSGTCFTINIPNIVLDCDGYSIIGDETSGHTGIYINNADNVTIKNCDVRDFHWGIQVYSGDNTTIYNNTLISNNQTGVYIHDGSSFSTIYNNTIDDSYYRGLEMITDCHYNNVSNNLIANTVDTNGITCYDNCSHNLFDSNRVENNKLSGFWFTANARGDNTNNTITNNVFMNNSNSIDLHYTADSHVSGNTVLNDRGAGIWNSNSDGNTYTNNTVSFGSYQGYQLFNSTNLTVSDGRSFNNSQSGIWVEACNDSVIYNMVLENNTQNGLQTDYCLNINVTNVTANFNGVTNSLFNDGFQIDNTSYSTFTNVTGNNNAYRGMEMYNWSSHNIIEGSTFNSNTDSGLIIDYNTTYTKAYDIEASYNRFSAILIAGSSRHNVVENSTGVFNGAGGLSAGVAVLGIESENNTYRNINASYNYANFGVAMNPSTKVNYFYNITAIGASLADLYLASGNTFISDSTFNNYYLSDSPKFALEKSGYATLQFLEVINAVGLGNNMSNEIVLGNNSVYVDTVTQTAFNRSANITLIVPAGQTGLRVAVDHEDDGSYVYCDEPDCYNLSYVGDEFKFNVTRFTNYTTTTNLLPYHTQNPILNSTSGINHSDDDLTCWVFTTDPDGDPVDNEIKWYKNTTEQPSLENLTTISSGNTSIGDEWQCSVRPFDSVTGEAGSPQPSNTVYIQQMTCGPLTSDITLGNDVTTTDICFRILNTNITLDCDGHSITGDGSINAYAVRIEQNNVTIKNCVINNMYYGITTTLTNMNNVTMLNNTINSSYKGIYIPYGMADTLISGNTIYDSGWNGIYAIGSSISKISNSIIYNNTILNTYHRGIELLNNASYNNVSYNTVNGTQDSVGMICAFNCSHNKFDSNIINNTQNSVGFWITENNPHINTNNTFTNNLFVNNYQSGLDLYFADNSTLINNTVDNTINGGGLVIHVNSYGTYMDNNTITNSNGSGLLCADDCSYSTITNLVATGNALAGIQVSSNSKHNYFENITATGNTYSDLSAAITLTLSGTYNNTFRNVNVSYSTYIGFGGTMGPSASFYNITSVGNGLADIYLNDTNEFFVSNYTMNKYYIAEGSYLSLENPDHALLNFTQEINAIGLANNIMNEIILANNSVYVDTLTQSGFNASADITLTVPAGQSNLKPAVDFNDDGFFEYCEEPSCYILSYVGTEFKFNVSSFTTYITATGLPPYHTQDPTLESEFGTNYTTEDLICTPHLMDPDGGGVIPAMIRWYKNLTVQPTLENFSVIDSGNTTEGDNWTCDVTPFDLDGVGPTRESNWLYILGAPPNFPPNTESVVVNTSTSSHYSSENVYCWASASDMDTDNLTAYVSWYNDTALLYSGTGNLTNNSVLTLVGTLGSGNTSVGDNITCSVYMYDGIDAESDTNNATVQIRGYGALTIWDDTDPAGGREIRYPGNDVYFFANYTTTGNAPISDGYCEISFNTTPYGPFPMVYDSGTFKYNRTFSTHGLYRWNVSCSRTYYDSRFAQDTVNITPALGITMVLKLTIPSTSHQVYVPVSGVGSTNVGQLSTSTWSSPEHYYISSWLGNSLYGLVHFHDTPVSIGFAKTSANHTLTLRTVTDNSRAFVVFSQGNWQNIDKRMELVESKEFMNEITPTFGFGLGTEYPIKVVIDSSVNLANNLILRAQQAAYYTLNLMSQLINNRPAISMST